MILVNSIFTPQSQFPELVDGLAVVARIRYTPRQPATGPTTAATSTESPQARQSRQRRPIAPPRPCAAWAAILEALELDRITTPTAGRIDSRDRASAWMSSASLNPPPAAPTVHKTPHPNRWKSGLRWRSRWEICV